jgi:hypothetical protein
MSFLGKLLRRGEKLPSGPSFKETLCIATAQGEAMRGDTDSEIKFKQDLAFKYEAIHDETVETILEQKCLIPQFIPKTKEDGTVEYDVDSKTGEVLRDGKGNPIVKYTQGYSVDNTMAACRNIVSHVNRLVFLQPKNAKLASLCMEDVIETAKLSMDEDTFDLGNANYLDSLWYYNFMLINDAENGNKVKSLLEITKRQRIEFGPEQKKGLM